MTRLVSLPKMLTTGFLALAAMVLLAPGQVHAVNFHPSSVGPLTVTPFDTYYDGSNGTLFVAVPLPAGATAIQFSATGSTYTDNNHSNLIGPDGLNASGAAPYNFTDTRFNGTYNGTKVGGTTGIDPALFGVFFSPSFSQIPLDSLNYRSDNSPDNRTLPSYTPSENQPFFIGDGLDQNNDLGAVPQGNPQTFFIPTGATELLLGIGADPNLADNGGIGYTVTLFDNSPQVATPEPASLTLLAGLGLGMAGYGWRKRRKARE